MILLPLPALHYISAAHNPVPSKVSLRAFFHVLLISALALWCAVPLAFTTQMAAATASVASKTGSTTHPLPFVAGMYNSPPFQTGAVDLKDESIQSVNAAFLLCWASH
jgi:hypothetical protein